MTKQELKEAWDRYNRLSQFIKEATTDSLVKETEEEQEKRIKHLLNPKNYDQFFDYYFGLGTPIPLADSPCADWHTYVLRELYNMRNIFQMRRVHRGGAKSIHGNVGHPIHLMLNDELYFGLTVGKNSDRAKLLLADMQVQLESNQRLIKDFGEFKQYGNWADGEFETQNGRYFLGLGIDQPFRGLRRNSHRLDFANIDDVEDREEALNPDLVLKRVEKITGDIGGAFGKKRRRTVISNNYITDVGILAKLLEWYEGNPTFRDHKIDFYDKNGKPTWHQRYSDKEAKELEDSTVPVIWEREYMNNPVEIGKLFKEKWIRMEKTHGNWGYDGILIFWDLSYKKDGDYKAMACVGIKNGKLYVIDVFCRKCENTEAMEYHYLLLKKLNEKGLTPLSFYDATAAQKEVFEPLWKAAANTHKSFNIPMPNHASGLDKHLRIEATLTNLLFYGTLVFSSKLEGTTDWKTAKRQILTFQKGTKAHDDFPDALECACRLIVEYFGITAENIDEFEPMFDEFSRDGF